MDAQPLVSIAALFDFIEEIQVRNAANLSAAGGCTDGASGREANQRAT